MRLTWRDGVATILAGVTVAVAVAVTQEWDWPLLGSVTAGVVVLGVVGLAMCAVGGSGSSEWSMRSPFTVVMSVLGTIALGAIVVGLITGSESVFVALAVITIVMWVASTTAHAMAHTTVRPMRPVHTV